MLPNFIRYPVCARNVFAPKISRLGGSFLSSLFTRAFPHRFIDFNLGAIRDSSTTDRMVILKMD